MPLYYAIDIKSQRYEEWNILATTPHHLRKAIKICKQIRSKLKLEEHPDKNDYRNYNNPNAKTFNYLGIEFNHNG
ncbi:hypothetical protein NAI66_12440, partial [Francisella tularensis subsp. holarctica]|nr:hypothetical protein [Francisella tularensis subsp. holarctica]